MGGVLEVYGSTARIGECLVRGRGSRVDKLSADICNVVCLAACGGDNGCLAVCYCDITVSGISDDDDRALGGILEAYCSAARIGECLGTDYRRKGPRVGLGIECCHTDGRADHYCSAVSQANLLRTLLRFNIKCISAYRSRSAADRELLGTVSGDC